MTSGGLGRPPRIGIAPVLGKSPSGPAPLVVRPGYGDVLRANGAIPVMLAAIEPGLVEEFLDLVDGLLLPGGGDLPPRLFGEEPRPGYVAMEAGVAELHVALARAAHARDLPTLGVCLGCQVMNVARGGSVIQDLAEPVASAIHTGADSDRVHPIQVTAGTLTAIALGTSDLTVQSRHHQAVNRLGTDLVATAFAPDRVVEAVEDPAARFFIGVQWHPERQPAAATTHHLFRAFARAAAGLDWRRAGS